MTAGQLGNSAALTNGFSAAFLGAGGIAVAGALLALVTLRQPPEPSEAPEHVGRGAASDEILLADRSNG